MDGWRRTAAFERGVGLVATLLLLAVVLRRPDLAVLALPFALGTATALLRRPTTRPVLALGVGTGSVLEGDAVDVVLTVAHGQAGGDARPDGLGAARVDLIAVTLPHGDALRPPGWSPLTPRTMRPARAAQLPVGGRARLRLTLVAHRWGRSPVGPAVVTAWAADGLFATVPAVAPARSVPVLPLRDVFGAVDAVPRAEGMVGPHRSRRLGEGTDIAEVRPFQPGDRLRRINWRVSQRSERLHVTGTVSDRDTEVVLCLDSRHELAVATGRGGRPARRLDAPDTSLDLGVRACAAIAEYYLHAGDRVGLVDLGQPLRRVRPGAGRGHLVRMLDVLLDVRGSRESDETGAVLALSSLPAGALVVVLSPLVGDDAFAVVARIARSGHPVVVVDTLPEGAGPEVSGVWTSLAWRVWRLDRQNAVDRLAEIGVPAVPWRGSGSLDDVLRDVSRAARAPRVRR